jgi:cytochrome c-type biogenesis protein CcmH
MSADPAMEKLVNEISAELRCLVCQNQTIADSHAELAVDLKNQVREMVAKGQTQDEIVDYMVQRYGDFVRYRPPVKPTTYLLWGGPVLLFIIGFLVLMFNLKKRKRIIADAPLSEEEHSRIDSILQSNQGSGSGATLGEGDK